MKHINKYLAREDSLSGYTVKTSCNREIKINVIINYEDDRQASIDIDDDIMRLQSVVGKVSMEDTYLLNNKWRAFRASFIKYKLLKLTENAYQQSF